MLRRMCVGGQSTQTCFICFTQFIQKERVGMGV
jgi:hypothetical protein